MLLVGGSPVGIGVYGYSLGSLRERIGGRSTFMRFQMLNVQCSMLKDNQPSPRLRLTKKPPSLLDGYRKGSAAGLG